jgi:glycosyltransferase involved in cell wall biosynthesis
LDKIQIIIPAYNEGDNIAKTLKEIHDRVFVPHEIMIVYDYDEDNTLPVVNQYILKENVKIISLVKNQYGRSFSGAVKTGLACAKHEIIVVIMADLSDDLSIVDKMYAKINEGYDIVCASRYMKGGKQVGGPKLKKNISRLAGLSLCYLTGIPTHDITNSFKMYRKKVVDNLVLESTGSEISMEIAVKAFLNGSKIAELPSVWRDRTSGKSRFKLLKWLPKYIYWYLMGLKKKL